MASHEPHRHWLHCRRAAELPRTAEGTERNGRPISNGPCSSQRIAIRRERRIHDDLAPPVGPNNHGFWESSPAGRRDRIAQTSAEIGGTRSIVADHARARLTEIELNPGIDTRLYPGP